VVAWRRSIFAKNALASGLIGEEQLDEASLRVPDADGMILDQAYADRLIELGYLNRWQAQQLLRGRSDFHLGPYHLIDSIGRGGMGEVYKAEHTFMGRIVAVKVLPRHKTTPDSIASFQREIRTQAQLDHENLVRAHDAGVDKNAYFLVTEFVPGTDLRRLVRKNGKFTMRQAAEVIIQAARGLEYAHSKGLIHRDIKPGNVLVTPEGKAKVSDLGLAACLAGDDPVDPLGTKIVGTADYLSPEQIQSPSDVTAVSDIYSLGCTLYYAVTGKVPFPGGTTRDKAKSHLTRAPLNPRVFNAELAPEFVQVISDMMAKAPVGRIQSATEVISRLSPFLHDVKVGSVGVAEAFAGQPIHNSAFADTEPIFFPADFDESPSESPSQISEGTYPVSAVGEETLPLTHSGSHPIITAEDPDEPPPVPTVLVVLILLGGAAALTALAVALLALF
jgi:serine/threonine protein kinase